MFEISRWYFCGTGSLAGLTTTLPTAHPIHKKIINLDSLKKYTEILKNSWFVTVFVKTVCYPTCVSRRSHWVMNGQKAQFPLTFESVRFKQVSAVCPSHVPSFKPIEKKDLKWSMNAQKPRSSEQMESGVLF